MYALIALLISSLLPVSNAHGHIKSLASRWTGDNEFGKVVCGKAEFGGKFDKSKVKPENIIPAGKDFALTLDIQGGHKGNHWLRYTKVTDKEMASIADSEWTYLKLAEPGSGHPCAWHGDVGYGVEHTIMFKVPDEPSEAVMEWIWVAEENMPESGDTCKPSVDPKSKSNVFRDCADVRIGGSSSDGDSDGDGGDGDGSGQTVLIVVLVVIAIAIALGVAYEIHRRGAKSDPQPQIEPVQSRAGKQRRQHGKKSSKETKGTQGMQKRDHGKKG